MRAQADREQRAPLGQGTGGQGTPPSARAPDTGPALRDRRGHNFPKRGSRAPSPLCQSCWRQWQLPPGAAASAVSTAPRCEIAARAGWSSPRPGPGPAGGAEVPRSPPGMFTRGGRHRRCSPSAHRRHREPPRPPPPPAEGLPEQRERRAAGRAAPRAGGGATRAVPYSMHAGLIFATTGRKAPGRAGSTGTAAATTSSGSAGRQPGRPRARQGTALPHRLLPFLPPLP